MSLYSELSATSQGAAKVRYARWAKKWLAENPESTETPEEVALSYGIYLEMVSSDYAGWNWTMTSAWGGPIPPRPPAP